MWLDDLLELQDPFPKDTLNWMRLTLLLPIISYLADDVLLLDVHRSGRRLLVLKLPRHRLIIALLRHSNTGCPDCLLLSDRDAVPITVLMLLLSQLVQYDSAIALVIGTVLELGQSLWAFDPILPRSKVVLDLMEHV